MLLAVPTARDEHRVTAAYGQNATYDRIATPDPTGTTRAEPTRTVTLESVLRPLERRILAAVHASLPEPRSARTTSARESMRSRGTA